MAYYYQFQGREEATVKEKEERGRGEMRRHTGLGERRGCLGSHPQQKSCCAPTVAGMHTEGVSI